MVNVIAYVLQMNIPYHEWLRDGPDDATATGLNGMVPIPTAPHTVSLLRRALTDKEQSQ